MAGGFFGGIFGGPTKVDTGNLASLYSQREGQISDFANQLATARSTYMNQLQNYSQNVYNMFGKNLAAQFGAAGGTPGSGAFASGLGREAAQLYGNLATTGYQTTVGGLQDVNSAQAGAYSPYMSSLADANNLSAKLASNYQNAMLNGIGQLAGTAVGIGGMYAMGVPAAPAAGGAGAGATPFLGGGSPSAMNLPFAQQVANQNYLRNALAGSRAQGVD